MAESRVAALIGNELTDGYVRTHLPPQGRWADAWDVFKSNFGKLVLINIITLLFFVPGIAVIYFKNAIISQMGLLYPFSSNPLFTYPFTPDMVGMPEKLRLMWDVRFYALLIVAGFIASIGVSGACFYIKKLINTHGKCRFKDFFLGIKNCYFAVVLPVTVFMVFIFASLCVSDWAAFATATGASKGGPITAEVFIILATVLVGVIAMWVLAVGVSYKVKLKHILKNAFVIMSGSVGTIIQTVIMVGFSLIPVWLLLIFANIGFLNVLSYIIFFFFGFTFPILSWLAYTQWVFDLYITPVVKEEEEIKKEKMTPKQLAAAKEEDEKSIAREILAAGKSELVGRPLRPIDGGYEVKELDVVYGREDIARVAADRQAIQGEVDAYVAEHKGDARYVEYEKMFAEREKALNQGTTDKKGKKKKSGFNRNNLLNK